MRIEDQPLDPNERWSAAVIIVVIGMLALSLTGGFIYWIVTAPLEVAEFAGGFAVFAGVVAVVAHFLKEEN